MENKGINNKLDAWLAFLSMDSPEMIMELSNKYPEFRAMYEHVYNICQNVEKVMSMYSEELRILDRNTVKYMVDQMQEEIKDKRLEQQDKQLERQEKELKQQGKQLKQQEKELQRLRQMLGTAR